MNYVNAPVSAEGRNVDPSGVIRQNRFKNVAKFGSPVSLPQWPLAIVDEPP